MYSQDASSLAFGGPVNRGCVGGMYDWWLSLNLIAALKRILSGAALICFVAGSIKWIRHQNCSQLMKHASHQTLLRSMVGRKAKDSRGVWWRVRWPNTTTRAMTKQGQLSTLCLWVCFHRNGWIYCLKECWSTSLFGSLDRIQSCVWMNIPFCLTLTNRITLTQRQINIYISDYYTSARQKK